MDRYRDAQVTVSTYVIGTKSSIRHDPGLGLRKSKFSSHSEVSSPDLPFRWAVLQIFPELSTDSSVGTFFWPFEISPSNKWTKMYERSLTNFQEAVTHEQNGSKYQLNSLVALEFSDDYTGEGFIFTYAKTNLYDICFDGTLYNISHLITLTSNLMSQLLECTSSTTGEYQYKW